MEAAFGSSSGSSEGVESSFDFLKKRFDLMRKSLTFFLKKRSLSSVLSTFFAFFASLAVFFFLFETQNTFHALGVSVRALACQSF